MTTSLLCHLIKLQWAAQMSGKRAALEIQQEGWSLPLKNAADTSSVALWRRRWLLLDFASCCYFYLWLTKLLSADSFKAAAQFFLQLKEAGFPERTSTSRSPGRSWSEHVGETCWQWAKFLVQILPVLPEPSLQLLVCIKDMGLSSQNVFCNLCGFNSSPMPFPGFNHDHILQAQVGKWWDFTMP